MKSTVVNLLGGPCCGKSTTAAGLFYELKRNGYQSEIAIEVAKANCWDESYKKLDDQIYVFGKQYHTIKRLENKVDFILAESPLLLSIIYKDQNYPLISNYWDDFVIEQFNLFDNKTYFIDRPESFTEVGRNHDYNESKKIDEQILDLLYNYNIPYERIPVENSVEYIYNDLINK